MIFRIPTPLFGAGLIEQIPDAAILANQASSTPRKAAARHPRAGRTSQSPGARSPARRNNNGNDGTIARFGWKAQNKSLMLFSGEAYNVEMGITNELFQTERDETPACQFATVPERRDQHRRRRRRSTRCSDIEKFSIFMRLAGAAGALDQHAGWRDSIQQRQEPVRQRPAARCAIRRR